jgi:hypothetical protein
VQHPPSPTARRQARTRGGAIQVSVSPELNKYVGMRAPRKKSSYLIDNIGFFAKTKTATRSS